MVAAVCPDAASSGWNREVLHADAVTPEALVEAGWALGLFGGQRLVVVRGLAGATVKVVERLRSAVDRVRNQAGGWPAEGTTVILMAPGTDRRAPVLRLLPDPERVEVRAPSGRAVLAWLRDRAAEAGLTLPPEAAEALVALVGEDLGRLAGELEKAAVHAGGDGQVTEAVVRALVGETRARRYWELTQALEEGKPADAAGILERLLTAGEDPVALVAWVAGYVRTLARVQAGLATSARPSEIAGLLRPPRPDRVVQRLMARAAAVGAPGVAAALRRCFEVERALKSSGASPRPLLTVLVVELAR